MENAIDIVVAIITILLSLVTSNLLLKQNYKKDIQLRISEERTDLYIQLYGVLDESIKKPELLLKDDYRDRIEIYKPKMKLIASEEVNNEFKLYRNLIATSIRNYNNFASENSPEQLSGEWDDDEEGHGSPIYREEHISESRKLIREYIENNTSGEEAKKMLDPIVDAMRKDIGSILNKNLKHRFKSKAKK